MPFIPDVETRLTLRIRQAVRIHAALALYKRELFCTAAGERADAEERDVVCRALAKLARADSGAGASASGAGGAEEESEADRCAFGVNRTIQAALVGAAVRDRRWLLLGCAMHGIATDPLVKRTRRSPHHQRSHDSVDNCLPQVRPAQRGFLARRGARVRAAGAPRGPHHVARVHGNLQRGGAAGGREIPRSCTHSGLLP